jgi:exodeoxyribonuclease VII small subunit
MSTSEQPPFEEAFTKLEEAVRTLEAGGVSLEEATRLFEEGMRLARVCHQQLSATELKITHLQRSFGEQMEMLDGQEKTEDAEQ